MGAYAKHVLRIIIDITIGDAIGVTIGNAFAAVHDRAATAAVRYVSPCAILQLHASCFVVSSEWLGFWPTCSCWLFRRLADIAADEVDEFVFRPCWTPTDQTPGSIVMSLVLMPRAAGIVAVR